MSRAELLELQRRKLQEVFGYLCDTPFYREKLSGTAAGLDHDDPLTSLRRLPFTFKHELRSTSPMLRTPLGVADLIAFFSSSGTTGQPSVSAWSKDDQQVYEQVSGRLLRNIGVGPGDVALLPLTMGMPLAWYAIFSEMRAVGAAVVPLGAAPLEKIAQALANYPVTILKTSPVVASRLFRFISQEDPHLLQMLHLRQIHLAGYFSSKARRRRLAEQWGTECYDMYGLSEIGLVGGECLEKNGQHFCADFVLQELIDADSHLPVKPRQTGVGVYTSLWKKGSPLLRYWSDDYITIDEAPCACGLDLPRITFRGRDIDCVVLDGRRLFASDVEEILLQDDGVGDEFQVEVYGTRERFYCIVQAESVGRVRVASLEEELNDLFQAPVELRILPEHAFERSAGKPRRITDRRE